MGSVALYRWQVRYSLMSRILHVALKYDYGLRERGLSFEHNNFYHALVNMGHDVLYFDIGEFHKKYGFESLCVFQNVPPNQFSPATCRCALFRCCCSK